MSRRPRRNHSAIFKAKVAVDAIRGEKTLAELAKVHDVHANQIIDWKNQLLERAASVFGAESAAAATIDLKELHAKLGQFVWRIIFWPARSMGHQAHSAEWPSQQSVRAARTDAAPHQASRARAW